MTTVLAVFASVMHALGAALGSVFGVAPKRSNSKGDTPLGYTHVDLGLAAYKTPTPLGPAKRIAFREAVGTLWAPGSTSHHKIRPPQEDPFAKFFGSAEPAQPLPTPPPEVSPAVGTADIVCVAGDMGLFGAVFEAWAHHAVLRTCPEDWWCVLITRVAARIDDRAHMPSVKNLFVPTATEKQLLSVDVNCPQGIYSDVYEELFAGFSEAIKERIAVPGYTAAVTADFSTTTHVQRLGSQITLMTSFQRYFSYEMRCCGCGISALEMCGNAADWERLGAKLATLKELLKPAEDALQLTSLFSAAERVFKNLHGTFLDGEAMHKWWSKVLFDDPFITYGPSGMVGWPTTVKAYNGWLVGFMLGAEGGQLEASVLARGKYSKELTCLSSTPIKIVDRRTGPPHVEDSGVVAAGIMGFKVHERGLGLPVAIEPAHGWVLMLPQNSPLRMG